jgi:hypothetical protein
MLAAVVARLMTFLQTIKLLVLVELVAAVLVQGVVAQFLLLEP